MSNTCNYLQHNLQQESKKTKTILTSYDTETHLLDPPLLV